MHHARDAQTIANLRKALFNRDLLIRDLRDRIANLTKNKPCRNSKKTFRSA